MVGEESLSKEAEGRYEGVERNMFRVNATSRSPTAYARTLCGHDLLGKEDYHAALASYREALLIDNLH